MEVRKTAKLSECQRYRYCLGREFNVEGKTFGYFGINPSTADAIVDDQTVKKWIGFTKRNGGGRILVGNVFAFRTKKVKELAKVDDPVGPDNPEHLAEIIAASDVLVPCWGSRMKLPRTLRPHMESMLRWLCYSGKPVMCFGQTKHGDPLHPQMLGYSTELRPWS